MIVEPDFLNHWKTQMLCDLLGNDALGPIYLLRLWGHCQNRKSWEFELSANAIRAICQFQGDAQKLEDSMIESGWLERNGDSIIVTGWADCNASLIAAWKNGNKGGRPRKQKPTENPSDNPPETHGLPMENPPRTDKRREEKSREDKKEGTPPSGGSGRVKRPKVEELCELIPNDFSPALAKAAESFAKARQGYSPTSRRFSTLSAFRKQCERMRLYPESDVIDAIDRAIAGEWLSWEISDLKKTVLTTQPADAFAGDKF